MIQNFENFHLNFAAEWAEFKQIWIFGKVTSATPSRFDKFESDKLSLLPYFDHKLIIISDAFKPNCTTTEGYDR